MNYQAALLQLPIPNDCAHIINRYLFLEKMEYRNKLLKSSVNQLMRFAINCYNDERYGIIYSNPNTYLFRWYPLHIQHQITFCAKCGNYRFNDNEDIQECCTCKCV